MTFRCSRSTPSILCASVLLFSFACASAHRTPEAPGTAAGAGDPGSTDGPLEIARSKLHVAELELALARKTNDEDQAHKAKELELAQGELRQFDEIDSPDRLARERLSLTRSQDGLAEQEEELAQLEMTYAEVDLSDKTREIVLRRNHRRVERAKEELALAERALTKLEQHTLPRERAKLALEVDEKTHALENAQRTAEIGLLGKNIALEEARAAVAKQEKGHAGKTQ